MTRDKDFKRLVRRHAVETGMSYTAARSAFLRHGEEARMVRVTCELTTYELSDEELKAWKERQAAAEAEVKAKYPTADVKVASETPEITPMMLLKEIDGDRVLRVACGSFEAAAIALAQQGIERRGR